MAIETLQYAMLILQYKYEHRICNVSLAIEFVICFFFPFVQLSVQQQ